MGDPLSEEIWRLEGFDTFSGESYPLPGRFSSLADAQAAAGARLADLELTQPVALSGGQAEGGIQDRVFIISPDGSSHRYTG